MFLPERLLATIMVFRIAFLPFGAALALFKRLEIVVMVALIFATYNSSISPKVNLIFSCESSKAGRSNAARTSTSRKRAMN